MSIIAAEESLKEGRLDDALAQLQDQVRRSPAEVKYRIFLFQLLALMGRWERALTQLNVCGDLDAANLAMVQTYREAIRCELLREKVFRGEISPLVFGQPEQWIALLIEASKLAAQNDYSSAVRLRDQAFEAAPTTSGTIDGKAFDWLADSDSRLGPVLEAIVNGRYYWIPFCRIARIELEPPSDLRDLVWLPAHFTWSNGGSTVGLIPSRYPGSESAAGAAICMARRTEWEEPVEGYALGSGQRVLVTNEGDFSLFDIREIALNADATENDG
ncbi:type VI secretion system accessory protein TagJ [Methylocaldum szegediense]|uniref:Type VI secretion system accessory component TagJ n=1 Tax=Methylocaldum szegediense TaxID=73780 RepID=A0ABM9HZX0_9GAMM|nr:type VI secretion system accessory protein TagJ [Methylocaldum szegediense]CAI8797729.1 Type VI secretion system accessory component TagJ [Methylocaldum szegediense]